MQVVCLTADSDGRSHFSDIEIELAEVSFAPPAPPIPVSAAEACRQVLFLTLPPGWHGEWHCSPRRQVGFCLSGRVRVEVSDGETREISAGGIWRMEDTTGDGHRTSVIGDEAVQIAIVQLE